MTEQFTEDDILDAFKLVVSDVYSDLYRFEHDAFFVLEDEAKEIMFEMGVDLISERVEWLNSTELVFSDILALSNVPFDKDRCNMCQEEFYNPQPVDWSRFQGVNEDRVSAGLNWVNVGGLVKHICNNCTSHPLFEGVRW